MVYRGGKYMVKLVKIGLIVVAVLALMYLFGSGQIMDFFNFSRDTLAGIGK